MEILESTFYHNTVLKWIIATGIAFLILIVIYSAKGFVAHHAKRLATRTVNVWDDLIAQLIGQTKFLPLLIIALYFGTLSLTFPAKATALFHSILVIAFLVQTAFWGHAIIHFFLARTTEKRMEDDTSSVSTINFVGFLSKCILWAVIVLLALDNLGINITALVAGMGVGGIAIALAAQSILGDLFASLSIALDKPFVNGDFVVVGDYVGTVEKIGLKTTRIQSLSGEQVIISNTDLLSSRIKNYKQMRERRVVFKIGVIYETPRDKLEQIPQMIRGIVEAQEKTRFDRAHFASFGDFSLDFEIVYYKQIADYTAYMDTQQAINLALFKKFEEEGIEFAYPTKVIYIKKEEAA